MPPIVTTYMLKQPEPCGQKDFNVNVQQMLNTLEQIEVDGSKPADFREIVRNERQGIMVRLSREDHSGAQQAAREAQRVLDMWRSFV